uniref:Coiled-coil domain containing 124 n=1 Tax=Coturnix japonica TaxID=93934 RepID=A0A8C2TFX8_COTJA
MPKKFQGENTKSAAARARKAEAKAAADAKRQQELEDAYWKDDDKHVMRKEQRKEEREKRRLEQLERKKELQRLLEEEDSKLKGKSPKQATPGKVTRAQIEESIRKDQQQKENAETGWWEHRKAAGTQWGELGCLERRRCRAALLYLPSIWGGGKETSCLFEVEKQKSGLSFILRLWLSFLCASLSTLVKAVSVLRASQQGSDVNTSLFIPFPAQWRRRKLTWRSHWRRTSTDGSWRKGQWRPGQ